MEEQEEDNKCTIKGELQLITDENVITAFKREVENSFLNKKACRYFNIASVRLINNPQLMLRYNEKKEELRNQQSGDPGVNIEEPFVFCEISESQLNDVLENGMSTGNCDTYLAKPSKGVCVQKHADVLLMKQLSLQTSGMFLMLKVMKGRSYSVNLEVLNVTNDPLKGFDCLEPSDEISNYCALEDSYFSSQLYLYEYGCDEDYVENPRHVLPVAVISYVYDTTKPVKHDVILQVEHYHLWRGPLFNNQTVLGTADIMCFTKNIKPPIIPTKLMISGTITLENMKKKYFSFIDHLDFDKEIVMPGVPVRYMLYLRLITKTESQTMAAFLSALINQKLAGIVELAKCKGVLIPPNTHLKLGLPKCSQRSLHLILISLSSAQRKQESLRGKRLKILRTLWDKGVACTKESLYQDIVDANTVNSLDPRLSGRSAKNSKIDENLLTAFRDNLEEPHLCPRKLKVEFQRQFTENKKFHQRLAEICHASQKMKISKASHGINTEMEQNCNIVTSSLFTRSNADKLLFQSHVQQQAEECDDNANENPESDSNSDLKNEEQDSKSPNAKLSEKLIESSLDRHSHIKNDEHHIEGTIDHGLSDYSLIQNGACHQGEMKENSAFIESNHSSNLTRSVSDIGRFASHCRQSSPLHEERSPEERFLSDDSNSTTSPKSETDALFANIQPNLSFMDSNFKFLTDYLKTESAPIISKNVKINAVPSPEDSRKFMGKKILNVFKLNQDCDPVIKAVTLLNKILHSAATHKEDGGSNDLKNQSQNVGFISSIQPDVETEIPKQPLKKTLVSITDNLIHSPPLPLGNSPSTSPPPLPIEHQASPPANKSSTTDYPADVQPTPAAEESTLIQSSFPPPIGLPTIGFAPNQLPPQPIGYSSRTSSFNSVQFPNAYSQKQQQIMTSQIPTSAYQNHQSGLLNHWTFPSPSIVQFPFSSQRQLPPPSTLPAYLPNNNGGSNGNMIPKCCERISFINPNYPRLTPPPTFWHDKQPVPNWQSYLNNNGQCPPFPCPQFTSALNWNTTATPIIQRPPNRPVQYFSSNNHQYCGHTPVPLMHTSVHNTTTLSTPPQLQPDASSSISKSLSPKLSSSLSVNKGQEKLPGDVGQNIQHSSNASGVNITLTTSPLSAESDNTSLNVDKTGFNKSEKPSCLENRCPVQSATEEQQKSSKIIPKVSHDFHSCSIVKKTDKLSKERSTESSVNTVKEIITYTPNDSQDSLFALNSGASDSGISPKENSRNSTPMDLCSSSSSLGGDDACDSYFTDGITERSSKEMFEESSLKPFTNSSSGEPVATLRNSIGYPNLTGKVTTAESPTDGNAGTSSENDCGKPFSTDDTKTGVGEQIPTLISDVLPRPHRQTKVEIRNLLPVDIAPIDHSDSPSTKISSIRLPLEVNLVKKSDNPSSTNQSLSPPLTSRDSNKTANKQQNDFNKQRNSLTSFMQHKTSTVDKRHSVEHLHLNGCESLDNEQSARQPTTSLIQQQVNLAEPDIHPQYLSSASSSIEEANLRDVRLETANEDLLNSLDVCGQPTGSYKSFVDGVYIKKEVMDSEDTNNTDNIDDLVADNLQITSETPNWSDCSDSATSTCSPPRSPTRSSCSPPKSPSRSSYSPLSKRPKLESSDEDTQPCGFDSHFLKKEAEETILPSSHFGSNQDEEKRKLWSEFIKKSSRTRELLVSMENLTSNTIIPLRNYSRSSLLCSKFMEIDVTIYELLESVRCLHDSYFPQVSE